MQDQTSDDAARGAGAGNEAAPAIVMIASGPQQSSLVVRPPAALGRRIVAGAHTHEVADDRMSRDHARVTWERTGWLIEDLASRNGTFVDGERITGEVRRPGDTILRLGHTVFVLLADGRGHPAPGSERDGESTSPPAAGGPSRGPAATAGGAGPGAGAGQRPVIAPIIGPELARAYDQIRRNAGASALLLQAEPGSGKRLAARLFHDAGPRRDGPFVAVDCATIPEGVGERLLFGDQQGPRAGGVAGAIKAFGHLQQAQGGTLFLDEIEALEPRVQAKLLRVLDRMHDGPLDLAVVAAGDRELEVAVADGQFDGELYVRLAQVAVELPPLRARRVDLARMVFRELAAAGRGLVPHGKLVEACCVRPWPGNIRELRDALRRAAADARRAGRHIVRVSDLGAAAGMAAGTVTGVTAVERRGPSAGASELDRSTIIAALGIAHGSVSAAARALGVHRTELVRLMDHYRIARED